jgi:hypothetical protein
MSEEQIAEIESGPLSIVVTLREHGELRFLEIRLYRKEQSGALTPTNWAVGMDASSFSEFVLMLNESHQHIQEWFGPRQLTVAERVHLDMVIQAEAVRNAAQRSHKIDVRTAGWNGPEFFSTRSEGGRVVVELNTEHVAVNDANSGERDNGKFFSRSLGVILAAYHDAKNLFCGTDHPNINQLFHALEYEWGVILKRYVKKDA